ncbi:phage-related protein [Paenibacillus sp. DS2015]|uniref:phage tail protein n=1 Tax=Paenibacillus sp. DS2015 TaxID=3373917 RepID=UPI003D224F58
MSVGSVGQIDLDLGLNYKQFSGQLNDISGKATGMVGNSFKKLGGIIAAAFAVSAMVGFGKSAINLASDLQEVQNVVDVTFGYMANDINNWSQTTLDAFGLSELSAKKYSSTIGAMMKSSGISGVAMEGMSKKLTELSADMASFYNLSNDFAFEKIRAGISGETEPLKQLGINMSVANMEAYALAQGITTSYQKMDQAGQTMLRYNYLLSVTGDAQGDFARTSNSWANQVKLMGEQWSIFKGTMGAGFINILTPIVRGINFLIKKLQIAAAYFKAFTELIFGAQAPSSSTGAALTDMGTGASDAGGSVADVGKAAKKAGKDTKKAAKDVKGSLSSFDMLNVIGKDAADSLADAADAAGSAGGAGAGLGGLGGMGDLGNFGDLDLGVPKIEAPDMSKFAPVMEFLTKVKDMATSVGKYLQSAFGPTLKQALDLIVPPIQRFWETLKSVGTDLMTLWAPLKSWLSGDLVPYMQKYIITIATIWAGLIDSAEKVFGGIWAAVFPILEWFVTKGLPLMTDFGTGMLRIWDKLFEVAKGIFDKLWTEGVEPGLMFVSDMIVDVLDIIKGFWDKWGKSIVDKVVEFLDNIGKLWGKLWDTILKPIWDNLIEQMRKLWDNHLKGLITEFTNFVGKLVTGALDIYNKFILPMIGWLIDKFGPTFVNVFNYVVDILGIWLGVIIDIVKGVLKSLGGIIDFLVGVFTGDWNKAWDGIKTFLSGIWDAIVAIVVGLIKTLGTIITYIGGLFKTAWDKGWEDARKTFDRLKDILGNIKDDIVEIFGNIITYVKSTFTSAWEKGWENNRKAFDNLKNGLSTIKEGIVKIFDNIITYIKNTFTTAWEKAWGGIKDFVGKMGTAMESLFKGSINVIIDSFNWMIKQLNKVSIDIPDWVPGDLGGKSFGVNVPTIPRLAKGGLATAPTLAMVGDNKNAQVDPEVITPLSKLQGMLGASNNAMVEVLLMILNAIETQETSLSIDGDKLTRVIKNNLASEGGRVGKSMITVGGVSV